MSAACAKLVATATTVAARKCRANMTIPPRRRVGRSTIGIVYETPAHDPCFNGTESGPLTGHAHGGHASAVPEGFVMRSAILVLAFTPALIAAPPEVVVCQTVEREVTDFAEFTGRVEPSTSVDVRSMITGYLDKVLFKEGAEVKKGDLLFQLDDKLQRAELAKAEAEATRAEARLKLAEADHQRIAKLLGAKAVTPEELDKSAAALAEAKAAIMLARATIEMAKHNLESTRIVARISGRIGRSRLDPGNIVRADADKDGPLATIIVVDPVHVAFDVDERTLLRVLRLTREREGAKLPVAIGVL